MFDNFFAFIYTFVLGLKTCIHCVCLLVCVCACVCDYMYVIVCVLCYDYNDNCDRQ